LIPLMLLTFKKLGFCLEKTKAKRMIEMKNKSAIDQTEI